MSTISSPHHMSTSNVSPKNVSEHLSRYHMSTISCPYHISHVNITHRPAKLSEHLWRYPMVNILCQHQMSPNKASIHLCRYHMSTFLVGLSGPFFFTYSILLRILPRLVYYVVMAAVAIDLSRPFEDCRTKLDYNLRKGVLPCETSQSGAPSL